MEENKNPKEETMENNSENKETHANRLLNILLAIIVIITVVSGAIIYYSLYTYSSEEIIEQTKNEAQNVSTIVDIINEVASANEVDENTVSLESTGNATVTTGEADNRKVLNEEIIVLYDGLVLDVEEMGLIEPKYIDNSSSNKDNYVITYYNYGSYQFKDSTLGTLSTQVLDGLVKIDNVGKVSISEKYDAIPREIQVVNSIPAVVLDNNSEFANYDTKKTIITDLDGNGTNEYIVILGNKTSGESKVILVESTGFIKAVLGKMDKSGWDSIATDGYYLSYSNIEVLDIDNDGIMEILFELPTTASVPSQISVLKYKNGELAGKTDVECTLVKPQ